MLTSLLKSSVKKFNIISNTSNKVPLKSLVNNNNSIYLSTTSTNRISKPACFNVYSSRSFSTYVSSDILFNKYNHMISLKLIKSSSGQLATLKEYSNLYDQLINYTPTIIQADTYTQTSKNWYDNTLRPYSPFGTPAESSELSKTEKYIKKCNSPIGLYVYGSTGCGKTMIMDLFYENAPVPQNRKKRIHFHKFMLTVHQNLHEERKKGAQGDALPIIAKKFVRDEGYLLCLDEFQVTDIADAMILQRLFVALWDAGCVVVATSNRPPDDLYYGGLNRSLFLPFIPVLKSNCKVVKVEDKDYRVLLKSTHEIYFQPLNENTNFEIQRIVDAFFSKEFPEADEVVTLQSGRSIKLNRANRKALDGLGVARFTFNELCEEVYGASDYIGLASNFTLIILENIPKFNPEKKAPLRRFITLIDVLYDANVRLICSAAAPADELFASDTTSQEGTSREDELFAFNRTLSRLMEMQSKEYLDKNMAKIAAAKEKAEKDASPF